MKNVKSQKSTTPGKQGGLNAEVQARIGHQLRAMYNDVVKQGVPDRFADLLREIDAKERTDNERSAASGTSPDTTDGGR